MIKGPNLKTGELVDVLGALDLGTGVSTIKAIRERQRAKLHARLRTWHHRGILGDLGQCAGPGSERVYSFGDILLLGGLLYATQRIADLDNAWQVAEELQGYLSEGGGSLRVLLMLSDGDWVRLKEIDPNMTLKTLGLNYTRRAPVVVYPAQLFSIISGAVQSVLESQSIADPKT